MPVQPDADWFCPSCGNRNTLEVDISAGRHQQFTEECAICDIPVVLTIEFDTETQEVSVQAVAENR